MSNGFELFCACGCADSSLQRRLPQCLEVRQRRAKKVKKQRAGTCQGSTIRVDFGGVLRDAER